MVSGFVFVELVHFSRMQKLIIMFLKIIIISWVSEKLHYCNIRRCEKLLQNMQKAILTYSNVIR